MLNEVPSDKTYSQKKCCSQMHFSTRKKWLYIPFRVSPAVEPNDPKLSN